MYSEKKKARTGQDRKGKDRIEGTVCLQLHVRWRPPRVTKGAGAGGEFVTKLELAWTAELSWRLIIDLHIYRALSLEKNEERTLPGRQMAGSKGGGEGGVS